MGKIILSPFISLLRGTLTMIFTHPLESLALVLGIIGGFAASDTWIGHLIGTIVNWGPEYTPHVLFIGSFLCVVGDLLRDGIPERFALYLPIVAPSFAMAIPETSGGHQMLAGWLESMNAWLNQHLGAFLGLTGKNAMLTFVAITSIVVSVVVAERYARNARTAKLGITTTSTTGTAPTPGPLRGGRRSARS